MPYVAEPICCKCGQVLPENYAQLMDARGACGECVEKHGLKVFVWKRRSVEEYVTGG